MNYFKYKYLYIMIIAFITNLVITFYLINAYIMGQEEYAINLFWRELQLKITYCS